MLERFRHPVRTCLVLLLTALTVAACSTPAQAPQPQSPQQAAPAPKTAEPPGVAAVQPGLDKDRLVALIEAAKKDGEVSFRTTLVHDYTAKALGDAFKAYYGLPNDFKVTYDTDQTGGSLTTKTMAEISAGKLTADIISTGTMPLLYDLLGKNELAKYDSPVYKAYGPAQKAGITEPGYWVADAYAFTPYWNTQLVPKGAARWQDFLDPSFMEKIAVPDIVGSDIASAYYVAMKNLLGAQYWDSILKLKPALIARADDAVAKAATGERPLGQMMPSRVYAYAQKGAPLESSFPADGVLTIPQPWVILAKAPHQNGAKLWIDFIFSDRGQQVYQLGEAIFSGREGFVPPPEVAKYGPPLDKVKPIQFNWKEFNAAASNAAKAEARAIVEKYK